MTHAEFEIDGEYIKRYWIEGQSFDTSAVIEIIHLIQNHWSTFGRYIKNYVIEHGKKIGEFITDLSEINTSILSYHKYEFVEM